MMFRLPRQPYAGSEQGNSGNALQRYISLGKHHKVQSGRNGKRRDTHGIRFFLTGKIILYDVPID